LRIGVDQHGWAVTGSLGRNSDVGGQCGLPGAAFLAGENDNVHFVFLSKTNSCIQFRQKERKNAT
jgi:hypothetical protein